jgi:malate dehydrogenase (oxaloacetate-decarboxylating)(NADP+)
MDESLREAALEYHRQPTPGKIEIVSTKALETQRDLSLAYSPGVAAACEEIRKDPLKALDYTSRGNLVAVITNGTAVLGLGNIGALAAKPVMEGKAILFKKFANIDSIDIEINETDADKLVDIIASLEPSFGGINLEDIKSPECFEIERRLRERMKIPVFHDDQHGTAIIVGAAMTNWLHYSKRKWKDIKLVSSGAGAAAIACLNMLVALGLPRKNIIVCDLDGVVYKGRNVGMDPEKDQFAADTKLRTLEEAIKDADVFLGLSAANVISAKDVKKMAKEPLIMALANPSPEILPEEARKGKPDAIICTGRSDYPNQVNNALCFPYIFRGALDVGATAINEEMKIACVNALAALTRKEATAEVAMVYSGEDLELGPDYLIPKPFDPRLITDLPIAVARAAMESGVATRPIKDWNAYEQKLQSYTYRTSMVMRPLMSQAKLAPKRVVYTEGEEEKVLRAVQVVLDEGLAKPIVIGRPNVVETRLKRLHLRMRPGVDFQIIDPESDPRYKEYWTTYHEIMQRRGVTPAVAKATLHTNTTVIGALMVRKGDADAMLCGTVGQYRSHLKNVVDILGLQRGVETAAAMNALIMPQGAFFICDTQINPSPSIAQISEMTMLAVAEVKRFGIKPKVALLSHSNFGTHDTESAFKMRSALADLRQRAPDLEIDGEMQADAALSEKIRSEVMPHSTLKGEANLFIMPGIDSANIAFNMLKILGDAISIGPVLLGIGKPAHILTPSVTTRGLVNMTAVAVVCAQDHEEDARKKVIQPRHFSK